MKCFAYENSHFKTPLVLVMISCVTLSMLVAGAACSIYISNNYQYVYAAAKSLTNSTSSSSSSSKGGDGDSGSSVANNSTTPIGSKTFLTVITLVSGGTSKPSDFTLSVAGKNPSPKSFSGSSGGTSVTLNAGKYEVTGTGPSGYTTKYSSGCSGTASGGVPIKCTISNKYILLPPGSTTFLSVITKVDNTNGGTKKSSDFIISVSGNSPKPSSFVGSSSGTSVTLLAGKYSISGSSISGYTTTYSSGCAGNASGGLVKCIITNRYTAPPPGSITFLSVITKVDNTNGGTKKPSDFTISISGNSASPKSFSGSSSGTSVRLMSGSYEVTQSNMPAYKTSYSLGCSGTASGGVPIKCTIMNQYNGPPPSPPTKSAGITITSDSKSVYSIPSTFVKVESFGTNYTIAGKMSFINTSRNLINSTIIDDFDKNPNIGYVVNNSNSLSTSSQPGLPNPFVGKEVINQKIMNEIQNSITAASANNPPGKNVEINCAFGTILADYKCS